MGEASGEPPDTYSVAEAAKVLKLTDGRVRQMLRAGELEGIPPGEASSGERGWRVYMRSASTSESARLGRPRSEPRVGGPMLPHETPLVSEQQLRDASLDQIEDLVQRLNLALHERGMPGVVWRTPPEEQPGPSDPLDPGTLGSV